MGAESSGRLSRRLSYRSHGKHASQDLRNVAQHAFGERHGVGMIRSLREVIDPILIYDDPLADPELLADA